MSQLICQEGLKLDRHNSNLKDYQSGKYSAAGAGGTTSMNTKHITDMAVSECLQAKGSIQSRRK